MKLWLDCDPGPDDAHAIVMALLRASEVEVVGVSGVFGNTGLTNVMRNIAIVASLCGRADVPQHAGAERPLCETEATELGGWFGEDGLNGRAEHYQTLLGVEVPAMTPRSAAEKLKEATYQHDGELTVVAVGPLTNIAEAIELDSSLPRKWRRLVVLGGTTDLHRGQFNFMCDIFAAEKVLRAFSGKTDVLCLPQEDQALGSAAAKDAGKGQAGAVHADATVAGACLQPGRLLLVTREAVHAHRVEAKIVKQWGSYERHRKELVDFVQEMWQGALSVGEDTAPLNDVLAVAIAVHSVQLCVNMCPAKVTLPPGSSGYVQVSLLCTPRPGLCLDKQALLEWLQD